MWSCRALHTDPEAVIQTHKDFIEAGADIITTNTYQASAEHIRKHVGEDMRLDPYMLGYLKFLLSYMHYFVFKQDMN